MAYNYRWANEVGDCAWSGAAEVKRNQVRAKLTAPIAEACLYASCVEQRRDLPKMCARADRGTYLWLHELRKVSLRSLVALTP